MKRQVKSGDEVELLAALTQAQAVACWLLVEQRWTDERIMLDLDASLVWSAFVAKWLLAEKDNLARWLLAERNWALDELAHDTTYVRVVREALRRGAGCDPRWDYIETGAELLAYIRECGV